MEENNSMKLSNLKCDHQINPMVIYNIKPVFSFATECDWDFKQQSYRIMVFSRKELAQNYNGDMWDSGMVQSAHSIEIKYNGKPLKSGKTYYWMVTTISHKGEIAWSEIAEFGIGLLKPSDWKGGFIGLDIEPAIERLHDLGDRVGLPSPYLRRNFYIPKKVTSAKIFSTAYGVYELHLNGIKVGEEELAPLWTNYEESLQYQCYDITSGIMQGENAIGAILGDGWYTGNIAIVGRKQYGDYPLSIKIQIELEYEDGELEYITSDNSWKGSIGPIIYSDLQIGECYDATQEFIGFDTASFDDSQWDKVVNVYTSARAVQRPAIGQQVKVNHIISPIDIFMNKESNYIVDMGQNMVGRIALRINAERGTKIIIRHGEMLNDDKTLYTGNLRTALQMDTYICSGNPRGEVYEAKFTLHGFRFVEISGLPNEPKVSDITGKVIYSSCEQTGFLTTSNEMVNKLYENQTWGQRGNFVGVPTDCPQRDERMGWTGDAQIFAKTACYNMDCNGFYNKYIEDCIESQGANGAISDVVPHVKRNNNCELVGSGTAAWGDVIFVIPWVVYNMYGDIEILRKSYNSMVKYFSYLNSTTKNYLRPDSGYGDWLNVEDDTPKDVLSTAFFAYDAYLMTEIAKALDLKDDVKKYSKYFEDIKEAFNKAYVNEDIIIKGDTQCCYILALKMKLLDGENVRKAVKHLVRTIERNDFHLSTGFVGVSYLLPVLCDNNHTDLAYRLLLNETYPSWGYSIKNGATTIWERWNSYTEEDGFGDEGMNSFNHYSLGSVGEWMYSYMAGITPVLPGFKKIQIKPYIDPSIDFVSVEFKSVYGSIKSEWRKQEGGYAINVEIPSNTSAIIVLEGLRVNSKVKATETNSTSHVFEVEAGIFEFQILK
jgi:alpha-L-rhamnosidase